MQLLISLDHTVKELAKKVIKLLYFFLCEKNDEVHMYLSIEVLIVSMNTHDGAL